MGKLYPHISAVILLLGFARGAALAQVTQEWVARYDGPGNSYDQPLALAVDGGGLVYITGYAAGNGTSYDYATIKYHPLGVQLWVALYNGPGNYFDEAHSLAVDGDGNVYVTGKSALNGTPPFNFDYATIKYSPSGNQLWVARYNGPGNGDDEAASLVVDGNGNVYVTGLSVGIGTGSDYSTVKYNASGVQQWIARYNGPGDGYDLATGLGVDADNNVYVTGWSLGNGTDSDFATIKYDSSGMQQWVARYNGPANGSDAPASLAVDSGGNVYVTGYSMGSGSLTDYGTIKYDSFGNQLWVAFYNGSYNFRDEARSLAVDDGGNVYITGRSATSELDFDYATIKYDSSGNQIWVASYNGPDNGDDQAYALALDGDGNVYVAGYSYSSDTDYDYATIKYDSFGNQFWVARYNGPGNIWDFAYSLALDGIGNVYLTGNSCGLTSADYATIKYSQDQGAVNPWAVEVPLVLTLKEAHPNPFNATTVLSFELRVASLVRLEVFEVSGRMVTGLSGSRATPTTYEAGTHQITIDGSDLLSGVYLAKLTVQPSESVTTPTTAVQKLVLMK